MSVKPLTCPVKILSASILATDVGFSLNNIVGWDGNDLTSGDLGTQAFGAFLSADRTKMELFSYDPATIADSMISFVTRGLSFDGQNVNVPANQLDWTSNETYVLLGTDTPQFMLGLAGITNDNIFTGSNQFPDATQPKNPVTLEQLTAVVIAGGVDASVTAKGISQLTVAPLKSLATPTISIANPAVITSAAHGMVAGNSVKFGTSGTLPSPIVAGTTYYVLASGLTTNTFQIATSPTGSAISTLGSTQTPTHTLTDITPRAVGEQDPRLLSSANASQATAGTSGTPSTTNKFITENDTSNGVVYTASTISFTAATKTISDSANGFVTANIRPGDSVAVTGSVANNSTFTIVSVAAGAIVVVETVVDGAAGPSVTLTIPTANKVVRYSSTSQVKVPLVPVSSNDAVSKAYVATVPVYIIASSTVQSQSVTTKQHTGLVSDVPTKMKEIQVFGSGTITVTGDVQGNSFNFNFAIYKNGIQALRTDGTTAVATYSSGTSTQTITAIISVTYGDLVQFYWASTGNFSGVNPFFNNFTIKYDVAAYAVPNITLQ